MSLKCRVKEILPQYNAVHHTLETETLHKDYEVLTDDFITDTLPVANSEELFVLEYSFQMSVTNVNLVLPQQNRYITQQL